MDPETIENLLSRSLAGPLTPEELDELAWRLQFQEEQLERMRELPLLEIEPMLLPELEDARE